MAALNDLYRFAVYYDIIFRREVGPEVDFLTELVRRHRGRPPACVLDLGCGPGYHARAFARRGASAIGLDRGEEMVRFARDEATREGIAVDWRVADMRDFALPQPVDLALCLLNWIDGLCTIDDFVDHFRAVWTCSTRQPSRKWGSEADWDLAVQTTKPSARTSKSPSGRQVEAATVSLTRGQINAVRAAFKAGIKPRLIARQFGISQSDVRKVLASNAGA